MSKNTGIRNKAPAQIATQETFYFHKHQNEKDRKYFTPQFKYLLQEYERASTLRLTPVPLARLQRGNED
jgi:hypothetical protein